MSHKKDSADMFQDTLVLEFGFETLASRRLFNDIAFVYKLINCEISSSGFLRKISFEIPIFNSQNNCPFLVSHYSISKTKNSPGYRHLEACNNLPDFVFIFLFISLTKKLYYEY